MEILIIVLFVLLNGIFSMSEIAVVSSRKSKLESDGKKGNKTAKKILQVIESPDKFLSTIQIAITTIGLIIGLYTGESYVKRLADFFIARNMDSTVAFMIARVFIVVIETFFMLVVGELLPKRIGMSNPEKVASIIIGPMNVLSKIAWPFVWLLSKTTGGLASVFGIKNPSKQKATEEEIKSIIDDSADAGEINKSEQDLVTRVFDLNDRKIESIMTPRNDLEWMEQNENIKDIINRVTEDKIHNVYPVCDKNLDNIIGVVRIKDIFPVSENIDKKVKDLMQEPHFLHESVSIATLLETFKHSKVHYTFIIDEFGMVQGMVTMKDILEAIVGNSSELDTADEQQEFIKRDDGTYLVDGQYPFYDFLSHFNLEDEYPKYGYNTISGLIFAITSKVPKEGEKVNWRQFTFEIIDMDSVRIDKVLVTENKIEREDEE